MTDRGRQGDGDRAVTQCRGGTMMGAAAARAAGTHLREGRGDELALALPLLALGRDEVGPKGEQDLVRAHRLREARARPDDILCCVKDEVGFEPTHARPRALTHLDHRGVGDVERDLARGQDVDLRTR